MRRKSDTPTRGEVSEKVETNKEKMDENLESLDVIASDSETVRDTLDSLDFNGTAEGASDVTGAIEKASDVTVEKFNEEDEQLEEIQSESEEYEKNLQERNESSESDSKKVCDAIGQIATEETKGELEQAKSEIDDDINFLSEQNDIARESREETEKSQQEHRGRVQGGRS